MTAVKGVECMDAEKIVYKAMDTVTGLTKEDFADYLDLNLFSSGILDSLSLASVLSEISYISGAKIDIKNFEKKDFDNIGAFIGAVAKML